MNRCTTVAALVAFLAACPPATELRDGAGEGARDVPSFDARSADAGPGDAVQPGDAAGDASVDGGTPVDASGVDQGAAGDAGSCAAIDACSGVVASGTAHVLAVSARALSGPRSVALGDSLAAVRTHLSGLNESIATYNNFALVYCSEGLVLYFADKLDDSAASEGQLSDGDTLYKITAIGNFMGATDTSTPLALGDPLSTVTAALGTADYLGTGSSVLGDAGQFLFYNRGVSVLVIGDSVTSISLFQPQPAGAIHAAINFAAGTVGGVSVTHSAIGSLAVPSGSTLTQVRAVFGATPDADGDTTVNVGGTDVSVLVLSYSALGLRFSGTATQYSGGPLTGDNRKVFTAVITPPFQGSDTGIGVGTDRATIETRWGAPYASEVDTEGRTLHKYNTGSRKAGVMYAEDAACVERAALFFLNLIDLD